MTKDYWAGRAIQASKAGTPLTLTPVEWLRLLDDTDDNVRPPDNRCYEEPPVKLLGVPIQVVCPNCTTKSGTTESAYPRPFKDAWIS